MVQGGKKAQSVKKILKAHNFFVTKATDLKTIFLKSTCMKKHGTHFFLCLKQNKHIFKIFFYPF